MLGPKLRASVERMAAKTVTVRVGGQSYRLVASASEEEVQHLASVVDQKLSEIVAPGKPITAQSLLLVAMALAHELEEARGKADTTATRAQDAFGRLLERVDAALTLAGPGEPSPSSQA